MLQFCDVPQAMYRSKRIRMSFRSSKRRNDYSLADGLYAPLICAMRLQTVPSLYRRNILICHSSWHQRPAEQKTRTKQCVVRSRREYSKGHCSQCREVAGRAGRARHSSLPSPIRTPVIVSYSPLDVDRCTLCHSVVH